MHLGHKLNMQYYMKEEGAILTLATTEEERDLGVIIFSNLKPSAQCLKAANKAMSVLGMVKRNFRRLDVDSFNVIYKGYIRPHLFCIQAWSPFLAKDKVVLENVQQKSYEAGVWTEEQKLRRKIESSWFNHIGDTAIAGRLDRDLQDSTWEGRY